MPLQENKELIAELFAALNAGRTNLEEFFAPLYRNNTPPPGLPNNLEGVRQALGMLRAAVPDIHWALEDLVGDDDRVTVRLVMSGSYRDSSGATSEGRQLTTTGVTIFRIHNHKIIESWSEHDLLDLIHQPGGKQQRQEQEAGGYQAQL